MRRRIVLAAAMAAAVGAGCQVAVTPPSSPGPAIVTGPVPPSALVVVVDPLNTRASMSAAQALIAATARPNEHLFVVGPGRGTGAESVLLSSESPGPTTVAGPARPVPPANPTAFQRAQFERALAKYDKTVAADRVAARRQQQRRLAGWVASVGRDLGDAGGGAGASSVAGLGLAETSLSSLGQVGAGVAGRQVILMMGATGLPAETVPTLAGLDGTTVVWANFGGGPADLVAWQAGLVAAGASRAVVLSPGADAQVGEAVTQGLQGAAAPMVGADLMFGEGDATLRPDAMVELDHVAQLIQTVYPRGSVSVVGYADSVPAPQGNQTLSLQRAQAVVAYLVKVRGVDVGRIHASGNGDTDPIAPNAAGGQPLNRRVVVVIDPRQ